MLELDARLLVGDRIGWNRNERRAEAIRRHSVLGLLMLRVRAGRKIPAR